MDQVSATPSNWFGTVGLPLARGLRNFRGAVRPDEEANDGMSGIGRFIYDSLAPGEGAATELEHLSYGNMPTQVPEMTNVPQFKQGRADSFMDLVNAVPNPFKVANKLRKGIEGSVSRIHKPISVKLGATGDELDLAKKADSMYNMGSSNADVWAATGVTPIKGHEHRGATGGKYALETPINSANMPAKKHMFMGTEEKMDLLRMNDPESFYKLQAGHAVPQYILDYLKTDIGIRGTRKLGDMYDVSKIANKHPKLADSTIEVVQTPANWRGQYIEPDNKLQINLDNIERDFARTNAPFRHSVAHEWGGHGAQGAYNMPRGGSPALMQMHKPVAEDVHGAIIHNLQFNKNLTPEERTSMIRLSQALRQPDPELRYKHLLGEQQAETVANRATNNLYSLSPADDQNMVKVGGVDPKHWFAVYEQLTSPSGIGSFSRMPADQKADFVTQLLRQANTKVYKPY